MAEQTLYKDIRSAITFRSSIKQSDAGPTPPQSRNFTLNDYKWTDKYQINGSDDLIKNDTMPKLILIERQPVKKPDWSKILSSLQAIDSIPGVSQLLQTSLSPLQAVSQITGAQYLNALSNEFSSSLSKAKELLDISDIERLIEGPIVATYEIPFFNDTYMRSNNRDGWSTGSAIDSAGQLTELINDGFQLNVLKTPQWTNNSSDGMDWEVDFHLINDTLDSLYKNFSFINAIFPSTQWVRMKGASVVDHFTEIDKTISQKVPLYRGDTAERAGEEVDEFLAFTKSPNIFRVECPGRFLQLFVAIDMEVSYVGNVRQMPLHEKIRKIPLINESTLYPDAYRIRLMARDLTPNCYNIYASYLMNNDTVTVQSGNANALSSTNVSPTVPRRSGIL